MSKTLERLNLVFQDVFDDSTISVHRDTQASDIEAWDSLMHVTLMVNLERVFAIRFGSSEVAALKNVGELEDLINTKLGITGE